ncbi:MAG: hypothetical protein WBB98_12030 [Xanthobacteraceae bacterium]
MIVDSVSYAPDGLIIANNLSKAKAIPTLNMAFSMTGPANFAGLMTDIIAGSFATFDAFVDEAEDWLPDVFNGLAEERRGGDAIATFYAIGWSERHCRGESYSINMWTDDCSRLDEVLANSNGLPTRKLVRQTSIAGTPLPSEELTDACRFVIKRTDDYVAAVDLLHMAEIARHEEIEGKHWVGGKAVLTSIDAAGLSQKIIQIWGEDKIGEYIAPQPIDWKAWRADRKAGETSAALAGVDMSSLSRLQRERMMKKAKKGTLR